MRRSPWLRLGTARPVGRRSTRGRVKIVNITENLDKPQPFIQFLDKRCHCASFSNAHLFGPGSFLWAGGERQAIVHFCLFWQLIGVTISRRCAAEGCADAQDMASKDGERLASTRFTRRTIMQAASSRSLVACASRSAAARLLVWQQQQVTQQHQQEAARGKPTSHTHARESTFSRARCSLPICEFVHFFHYKMAFWTPKKSSPAAR